jgi:transcriptional regulator of acetoin/glycerol metabolism
VAAIDLFQSVRECGEAVEEMTRSALQSDMAFSLMSVHYFENVPAAWHPATKPNVVARCLHEESSRRDARFVAINCGGVPEQLFESEMFGHEAGAFTSANKRDRKARVGEPGNAFPR